MKNKAVNFKAKAGLYANKPEERAAKPAGLAKLIKNILKRADVRYTEEL